MNRQQSEIARRAFGASALAVILMLSFAGCASPRTVAQRLADAERAGVCPVHHQTLQAERVPITYGLVMDTPEGLREAELARFPFARRDVLGGCLVVVDHEQPERGSPQSTAILVCAACEEAKARWMRHNPSHPWTDWWRASAAPEDVRAPSPASPSRTTLGR